MKTFYYTDELHDDFAGTDIDTQKIDGTYRYLTDNPVRKGFSWFFHHIVVTPLVFLYNKIGHGERIVGRKKLKPYRKTGYYLYGNHTRATVYIDGPFFPDPSKNVRENREELRAAAYEAMTRRSEESTFARSHYVKVMSPEEAHVEKGA